ncbi:MAG: MotA/TolQ/ExbB proton channel family protein [Phycisphaeraceae bacterium]
MIATFEQGGWVLVVIAALSLAAWTVLIWTWLDLRARTAGGGRWVARALEALRRGQPQSVDAACADAGGLLADLLRLGARLPDRERDVYQAQLMPLWRSEETTLRRPLSLVAVSATVLPLLGLLGTVLGMVQTFAVITRRGVPDVGSLADGVSQALITTQAGLVVAVPILLAHGYLASRVQRHLDHAALLIKKIETICCED